MTSISKRESDIRTLIYLIISPLHDNTRSTAADVDREHRMRLISFAIPLNLSHSLDCG